MLLWGSALHKHNARSICKRNTWVYWFRGATINLHIPAFSRRKLLDGAAAVWVSGRDKYEVIFRQRDGRVGKTSDLQSNPRARYLADHFISLPWAIFSKSRGFTIFLLSERWAGDCLFRSLHGRDPKLICWSILSQVLENIQRFSWTSREETPPTTVKIGGGCRELGNGRAPDVLVNMRQRLRHARFPAGREMDKRYSRDVYFGNRKVRGRLRVAYPPHLILCPFSLTALTPVGTNFLSLWACFCHRRTSVLMLWWHMHSTALLSVRAISQQSQTYRWFLQYHCCTIAVSSRAGAAGSWLGGTSCSSPTGSGEHPSLQHSLPTTFWLYLKGYFSQVKVV